MRTAIILALVAACTADAPTSGEPAQTACPVVEPFHSPGTWRPVVTYVGAWVCIEGCGEPAPVLTTSTLLMVDETAVTWSISCAVIERARVEPSAVNCWRAAPVDDAAWCRSALDICGINEPQSGDPYVVAGATWTSPITGRSQRWIFAQ